MILCLKILPYDEESHQAQEIGLQGQESSALLALNTVSSL